MTNRQATFLILDNLSNGNYYGSSLTTLVHTLLESKGINKKPYPSTILSYCRQYADISGADFVCISNKESLYNYIPNVKISNALCYSNE